MAGRTRRARLPWELLVAVVLAAAPLPFLPHVLVPGAVDTAERVDPGARQFVQTGFDLFAGDVLAGRVTVRSGPPVTLYVMDEDQFQGLRVAGFVEPSFSASGRDINFSYTAPKWGTFHVVVGHTQGNDTVESAVDVRVSATVNPLLLAAALGSEGVATGLFLGGVRRYSRAVLKQEREDGDRVARRRTRDK